MSLKDRIDVVLTLLTAACALTVTGIVLRRELTAEERAIPKPAYVKAWKDYAIGVKTIGPATAKITIVEFSDFQCPFCGVLHTKLTRILAQRPKDIRLVYRSLPITSKHPHAWGAALAAECAAAVGRFGPYHDLLFSQADSLNEASWMPMAIKVGIADTARFEACRTGREALRALQSDTAAASKLQVHATPTMLINGWRYEGVPPDSVLSQLLDRELGRAR